MTRPVIVLGGGGHAKVLIETLITRPVQILGVTLDKQSDNETFFGLPVLGDDNIIYHYPPNEIMLVNGLGSVRQTSKRAELFERFKSQGYSFLSITHPSAVVASDVVISEGVQVMAGAIIQPGSRIGPDSIINTRASVDHDCIIGAHVHIAPGVIISGGVKINEGAHIGTGAIIIQGIEIGAHCLIGAGSLVVKNIPADKLAMGVPATVKDI